MDTKQLLDLVQRYHDNKDFITNEETAKVALVIPFIRLLGYDPSMPREVRPEFTAEFVQGDGKRLPDRMDFAIFDKAGSKPLMVIETKPLGTDLEAKAQQLARYIAQLSDLHFGIITDGCQYLFFGDLENPNQMDKEPFFSFSLEDGNTDWAKVAKFLSKFSREAFNAETLVIDAENSRYRQAMIERLAAALRAPNEDEGFMKWLTAFYDGKRTATVMTRLGDLAREAIEPALFRVIGDDFLAKLKERIQALKTDKSTGQTEGVEEPPLGPDDPETGSSGKVRRPQETTEEELEFFRLVRDICSKAGVSPDDIVYKDTVNYLNISFRRPTKWFLRFFSGARRKSVITWVPMEEAKQLAHGFEVEVAPSVFGISRVYIDSTDQLWALKGLIAKSLQLMQIRADDQMNELVAEPASEAEVH